MMCNNILMFVIRKYIYLDEWQQSYDLTNYDHMAWLLKFNLGFICVYPWCSVWALFYRPANEFQNILKNTVSRIRDPKNPHSAENMMQLVLYPIRYSFTQNHHVLLLLLYIFWKEVKVDTNNIHSNTMGYGYLSILSLLNCLKIRIEKSRARNATIIFSSVSVIEPSLKSFEENSIDVNRHKFPYVTQLVLFTAIASIEISSNYANQSKFKNNIIRLKQFTQRQ